MDTEIERVIECWIPSATPPEGLHDRIEKLVYRAFNRFHESPALWDRTRVEFSIELKECDPKGTLSFIIGKLEDSEEYYFYCSTGERSGLMRVYRRITADLQEELIQELVKKFN
jgi:hypothetical protein